MGLLQSKTSNPSGTVDCQPCKRCCSVIGQCPLISWLTSLDGIERYRLAGIILSCLSTVLVMISISTEFWVERFVRGIFVFRGLWIDCQMGSCARPERVYFYTVFSIFLMLISVLASYGSVITGTLSLTPLPRPKKISWPWLATFLSFISGLTGAMGLYHFMRNATIEPGAYLSWSLIHGWFAVIVIFMAGICYFWASRWEQELLSENLYTSRNLLTLAEQCKLVEEAEAAQGRQRPAESDTSE